ncbi:MAG: hypothetical protein R3Y53_01555 [Bacillota bacterium]
MSQKQWHEKKVQSAIKNTNLPKLPDMQKIEELVMHINKGVVLLG